jgi:hypothetical protein
MSGLCALFVLTAPAARIAVPVGAAKWPVGALVQAEPAAAPCPAAQAAARLVGWPAALGPASGGSRPGDRGCVPTAALAPLDGRVLRSSAPLPGAPAGPAAPGTEWTPRGAPVCGGPLPTATGPVPLAWLHPVEVLDGAARDGLAQVRAAASAAGGGPVPEAALRVAPSGRVGLPLVEEWDEAAIAAERAREGLDTPARAERVTVGRGPAGLYTHFWGADAPFSDLWGPPDVIASWLRLFADWATHCASTLHPADPTRCTPQVGDLGWFGPARPDPLGHKDHIDGRCLDLRLFRVDGSRYEAFWDRPDDRPGRGTAYDGPTTRAFVAFVAARPEVGPVFFNDPAAAGAQALPGHDDHIHLCVRAAP